MKEVDKTYLKSKAVGLDLEMDDDSSDQLVDDYKDLEIEKLRSTRSRF